MTPPEKEVRSYSFSYSVHLIFPCYHVHTMMFTLYESNDLLVAYLWYCKVASAAASSVYGARLDLHLTSTGRFVLRCFADCP